MLPVPYIPQYDPCSCGAAALEMVYKYYGLTNAVQRDIFKKYKRLEPHNSGNYCITLEDLVSDIRGRGFLSDLCRADYSSVTTILSLKKDFIDQGIPIVVCQQYTKALSWIGHYRVIIGIDDKFVYFHDPDMRTGGKNIQWTHDVFMEYWQPTGDNVKGGFFFFVAKK